MFTGLIEEIGTVAEVRELDGGREITVRAATVLADLAIDNSIAIDGVCQTVVRRTDDTFTVVAVEETLRKTAFGALTVGRRVNLERALTAGARLGGHLVQGHVDTTGTLLSREPLASSTMLTYGYPVEFRALVIPVGSICIDGVSLTVARLEDDTPSLTVAIIPYTLQWTTLGERAVGEAVNLEFDLLGKYVLRAAQLRTDTGQRGIQPHA